MRTVLYYAAGGGLGHLVRAASFLHTRGLESRGLVMTSLAASEVPEGVTEVPIVSIPLSLHTDADGLARWIAGFLRAESVEAVYLDAFPRGVLGEWTEVVPPSSCVLHHVARLLAWDRYRSGVLDPGAGPRFERTFLVESLHPAHHAHLAACSRHLEVLDLRDPPVRGEAPAASLAAGDWLVVHSGPAEEVEQLVRYAEDARRLEGARVPVVVATRAPLSRSGTRLCPDYPASRWFPIAGRVFSGAGFNVMRQMRPWAAKHRFIPFERRFDDQFERARRRREEVATCPIA